MIGSEARITLSRFDNTNNINVDVLSEGLQLTFTIVFHESINPFIIAKRLI